MTKEERTQMLNELFGGIGRIVEEDDRFICYVDKKTIEDLHKNGHSYKLEFYGFPISLLEQQKVDILEYRLNKPIYYVIDGFNFDSILKLSSSFDCKVIFKNCTFVDEIYLLSCVDVEFENNTYKDDGYLYYGDPQYFLTAHLVNKLSFVNDNFINSEEKKSKDVKFGILIRNAKKVEFINTRVETDFPTTINADTIRLDNSRLKGTEFDIKATSVTSSESIMIARDGVIIDDQNCDFVGDIKAPIVFYNGTDVTNYRTSITTINSDELAKREARVALIDTLHKVEDEALQRITTSVGDIYGIKPNTRKKVP